jgi:uncharacterized protein (TIRG00374 family)
VNGRLATLLKILVSAGLIIYLLRGVDLEAMGRLILGAHPLVIGLALAFYLAAIAVNAYKWGILLRAQGIDVPLPSLLSYTFAGLFFGNILPSNIGGDLVRAYDLARHTGYLEGSAISVLIDRLVGLMAFLAAAVIMAVVAVVSLGVQSDLDLIMIATIVAFAAVVLGMSLLLSRRLTLRLAFLFRLPVLSALRPTAQRVFVALQVYRRSYRALGQAFLLSLGIVLLTALVQWFISLALGLPIPFFYFLLFNPLIAFVLIVPISVNGIGLKEMAFVFFFGLVGVEREQAFSISLVFHAVIVLASLPGGLVWWRERAVPPIALEPETSGQGGDP